MKNRLTLICAVLLGIVVVHPASAAFYKWEPQFSELNFSTTQCPRYVGLGVDATFKITGWDLDNYEDPIDCYDGVHAIWTFSGGTVTSAYNISRCNDNCTHYPDTVTCKWSNPEDLGQTKTVSISLVDDGRFATRTGTSKDQYNRAKITQVRVVSVDLSVAGIDEADEENTPGKTVSCNTDDDNASGGPDKDETGLVSGENDLVPATITWTPASTLSALTVDLVPSNGNIKVWSTPDKGTQLTSFAIGTATSKTVYIEGLANGDCALDAVLKYAGKEVIRDKVAFTVQPMPDTTPPSIPVVIDDGELTASKTTLHATWSAADLETGIVEYKFAIGTTAGGTDVTNGYQSAGTDMEVTLSNLTLSNNTTYFFSVRAYNGSGGYSEGYSDGIKCIGGNMVFVRPAPFGSDGNSGHDWASAKATVTAALGTAVLEGKSEVWVAAGTYVENITLPAGIKLYGAFTGQDYIWTEHRSLLANQTIIDGGKQNGVSESVVVVAANASNNTVLDGFTIQNGKGFDQSASFSYLGGGVYCVNASPVISHNIITMNGVYGETYAGGGIYCQGGNPQIVENTITGNIASDLGAGIYCYDSTPQILRNVVSGQSGAAFGGGICCQECALVSICGNTITNNAADSGGGIVCANSGGRVANNVISRNSAESYGCGVHCADWGLGDPLALVFSNNTITFNTGAASASYGGGICCWSLSPDIVNNIVAFNSSGICAVDCQPALSNNDVFDLSGTAYNYIGLSAGQGDISVDPNIVGWHLQQGSPCIDAGNNAVALSGDVDIDGQSRRLPTSNSNVDIGADEWNVQDNGIGAPIFNDELSFFSSLVNYCVD